MKSNFLLIFAIIFTVAVSSAKAQKKESISRIGNGQTLLETVDFSIAEKDKTQILVLGTNHLSQSKDFNVEALNNLIKVLETFKPDLIGVEQMPPDLLNDIENRTKESQESYGKQLSFLKDIQRNLNLSRREAELKSREMIKQAVANGNNFSVAERKKFVAVLLASYAFNSAVLQWSYLPEADRKEDDLIAAQTVKILNSQVNSKNEIYSLGVRLARNLNLPTVEPIDDLQDEDYLREFFPNLSADLKKPVEKIVSERKFDVYAESQKSLQAGFKTKDLLPHYLLLNSVEYQKNDIDGQWNLFLRTKIPSGVDRARLSLWEMRNLDIAAKIRRATAFSHGKKMLVIIGAAHKPFLDDYLSRMIDVKIVHLKDLIKK